MKPVINFGGIFAKIPTVWHTTQWLQCNKFTGGQAVFRFFGRQKL